MADIFARQDRFAFPRQAHTGQNRISNENDDFNEYDGEPSFPSLEWSNWRHVLGVIALGGLVLVAISQFWWPNLQFLRGNTVESESVRLPSKDPQNTTSNILNQLQFPFQFPEMLSLEQLQTLQSAVMRYVDERVRQDVASLRLQHEEMVAKQTDLNELRRTYQTIAKQFQTLRDRYKLELEEKNQEIKAEREKYLLDISTKNEEFKRIRTTHEDISSFMEARKKREGFLNETIRQEMLLLFDEVASPKPIMERAKVVRMWLLSTFVLAGDLQSEMRKWQKNLVRQLEKIVLDGISAAQAKEIAKDAYEKFLSDQTGLFDFALKSTGASILTTRDTLSAEIRDMSTNMFGMSKETVSILPVELIITPGFLPGQCWPFHKFPGTFVVKLAAMTQITSFGMDYMPRKMSPTGRLLPAPKVFEVYGLNTVWDTDRFHFGTYEYDADTGENVQIFPVQNWPPAQQQFQIVELKVLSNHGSTVYTSVCRFRVHGNVTEDSEQCANDS